MGKKRKTESSKVAPSSPSEPLRNGKPSPPLAKRKKTGKHPATPVESGNCCAGQYSADLILYRHFLTGHLFEKYKQ